VTSSSSGSSSSSINSSDSSSSSSSNSSGSNSSSSIVVVVVAAAPVAIIVVVITQRTSRSKCFVFSSSRVQNSARSSTQPLYVLTNYPQMIRTEPQSHPVNGRLQLPYYFHSHPFQLTNHQSSYHSTLQKQYQPPLTIPQTNTST
jgi:hypothetical protein